MNIILGNGISSYIIAACLEYQHKEFEIYANVYDVKLPEILFLRCENIKEINKYLEILGIVDNQNDFIQRVKVGYFYNDKIHDVLTKEAKETYLKKQSRNENASSLSDGKNEFMAINLAKVLKILKDKYTTKSIDEYVINDDDTIYDTINVCKLPVVFKDCGIEYVKKNESFDVKDYSYVYDCTKNKIKRYTSANIEYLSKEKDSFVITNYYDSPVFYKSANITLISRYATKTQMKQKDIIDFIIDNKGEVKYV